MGGGPLPQPLSSMGSLGGFDFFCATVVDVQRTDSRGGGQRLRMWRLWPLKSQQPLCAGTRVSSYLWPDLEEPRICSINQLSTACTESRATWPDKAPRERQGTRKQGEQAEPVPSSGGHTLTHTDVYVFGHTITSHTSTQLHTFT